MLEEPNLGYDDAKYMAVTSSAFVNYLAAKAQAAGILGNSKWGRTLCCARSAAAVFARLRTRVSSIVRLNRQGSGAVLSLQVQSSPPILTSLPSYLH